MYLYKSLILGIYDYIIWKYSKTWVKRPLKNSQNKDPYDLR